jgi:hypothetical protein
MFGYRIMIAIAISIACFAILINLVFDHGTTHDSYAIFRYINGLVESNMGNNRSVFLNADEWFPDHWILESPDNFNTIREEVLQVVNSYLFQQFSDFDDANEGLEVTGTWRTLPIMLFGRFVNMEKLPKTIAILKHLKRIRNAFISILEPHTALKPHEGPFTSVVRYHLCLYNPNPEKTRLILNHEQTIRWYEGKSFMFDDRFIHYAENTSNYPRIILFLDIIRKLPWHIQILDYLATYIATFSFRYRKYVDDSAPMRITLNS